MRFLSALSDLMVPVLIFYVVGLGLLMKQDVFGDFLNGAKDGMRTVIGIVPTLIGLMAAVGVLRSSGFLEEFGKLLGTVLEPAGIPSALVRSVLCVSFPTARRWVFCWISTKRRAVTPLPDGRLRL